MIKAALKKRFPRLSTRLYWALRDLGYRVLAPVDSAWIRLNGRTGLPPIYLRYRTGVGAWGNFEAGTAEFRAFLKLIGNLQPHERVLDIGCGCGAEALWLVNYLNARGSYAGFDVYKPGIAWAQRHIASGRQNFVFKHLDVKNDVYNPHGQLSGSNWRFPFDDGSFDLIYAKSLFTHLLPQDAANYLKEIARLLSPRGRCLATFYLLNEATKRSRPNILASRPLTLDPGPGGTPTNTPPRAASEWRRTLCQICCRTTV